MRPLPFLAIILGLTIITNSAQAHAGARALKQQAEKMEAQVGKNKMQLHLEASQRSAQSSVTKWNHDHLADVQYIYPSDWLAHELHRDTFVKIAHTTKERSFVSNVLIYRTLYPMQNTTESLDAFFTGINVSESGYYRYAGDLYIKNYKSKNIGNSELFGQFAREYRYTGETDDYQPYAGAMILTAKNGYVYAIALQASPTEFDREYEVFTKIAKALDSDRVISSSSSKTSRALGVKKLSKSSKSVQRK